MLNFRRVLGGGINVHPTVFLWDRQRNLTLQIEVVLTAADGGAPQAMGRLLDGALPVVTLYLPGFTDETLGIQSIFHCQDRVLWINIYLGQARRTSSVLVSPSNHRKNRFTEIPDAVFGQ